MKLHRMALAFVGKRKCYSIVGTQTTHMNLFLFTHHYPHCYTTQPYYTVLVTYFYSNKTLSLVGGDDSTEINCHCRNCKLNSQKDVERYVLKAHTTASITFSIIVNNC